MKHRRLTGIITGDVINSKQTPPRSWLKVLKNELNSLGDSPKIWEIYRGDSFQVQVKDAADVLFVSVCLKAAFKSVKGLDIRIAIGVGEKSYSAARITESNGTAFVYSGDLAEEIKETRQNLAVRSGNQEFDDEMNLYLRLALIVMNGWTGAAAQTVYAALKNQQKSQEELGRMLHIGQNAVSARLKRANYTEVMELIAMFRRKIQSLK